LTCLEVQSRAFKEKRQREREVVRDRDTGEAVVVTAGEIEEEKRRRKEMVGLRKELYGVVMGPLEGDPEWDDVLPIAQEEPEGALATISYPGEYAEGEFFQRSGLGGK
jgi:protein farnesyltransferase/geranylgeranyltransferase type-1 subunit alpha